MINVLRVSQIGADSLKCILCGMARMQHRSVSSSSFYWQCMPRLGQHAFTTKALEGQFHVKFQVKFHMKVALQSFRILQLNIEHIENYYKCKP